MSGQWCACSHHIDIHDLDGACAADGCDCEDFMESELTAAQEGYTPDD